MESAAKKSPPHVGWIGLGSMGLAMAMNIQKHLSQTGAPDLTYFNRTISRGQPLQEIGGTPASSIIDLTANTTIIFLSLSDDGALKATVDSLLAGDLQGKIIVDTSTVHPNSSAEAQIRLAEKGAQFVAAPVFGASPVAAKGQLLWVIAGPEDAVQAVSPFIVGVMGRGIIRLGEDVKQSSMLKTAGNFITAGMMELIAEAHVLAEKTGLGSDALESLIDQQYGSLALNMSKRLTTGAYMPPRNERPWSDVKLALKDVGHGIDCAEQAGTRLKIGEVALGHLKAADQYGDEQGRGMDSSSMYGVLRAEAGLSFESDVVKKRDEEESSR